jgi:uncharacterized protein YndB with AHSA1/START domain
MKTKGIRQTVTIRASPHDVYEALMDSKKHGKFTGGRAVISRKVGGRFNVFDGWAEGENLELVPDRRIVQSWRGAEWPEGYHSKVAFALAEVPGGTRLTFTQSGVPEDFHADIVQGWKDFYWGPMKDMLEK